MIHLINSSFTSQLPVCSLSTWGNKAYASMGKLFSGNARKKPDSHCWLVLRHETHTLLEITCVITISNFENTRWQATHFSPTYKGKWVQNIVKGGDKSERICGQKNSVSVRIESWRHDKLILGHLILYYEKCSNDCRSHSLMWNNR